VRSRVFLLIVAVTFFGFLTPLENTQASEIRVTVRISIKIMIKVSLIGSSRTSSMPPATSLSPRNIQTAPGESGSSIDISWSPPLNGTPSGGYKIELLVRNRVLMPDDSWAGSLLSYKVESKVNALQIKDLEPSSIYEVSVKAVDGYGEHIGEPTSFCSPSLSPTDPGCIFEIKASKGAYIEPPHSQFDPKSSSLDLPDKGFKTGSIYVSWSPAKNARSYVIQWNGQQSPKDFGEKIVPSSQTSTLITGLPGNHLYAIRVLALGLNDLYSTSFDTSAYSSPSTTTGPVLSGYTDKCNVPTGPLGGPPWMPKEFIVLGITPQVHYSQSDSLKTEAFLTRFRKKGDILWKNADTVLVDDTRCLGNVVYPNNSERREYFLPDLISDYEFQVAEVSITPSRGKAVGDWSISRWFGPNSKALNRSELDKLDVFGDSSVTPCIGLSNIQDWRSCQQKVDAFLTRGTLASKRFIADSEYRASQSAAEEAKAKAEAEAKAAAEKAAAELKAKQEAEAKAAAEKAAAELKARQEAEAKAAAEKAAAELKAKQEAEAKAAAEKAAASKKTTITCVKGKLTKKVTAVNPKCPAGYKKK
jgi:hypothetical protein